MTIIYETYKDEHTRDEYHGYIIYEVQSIRYSSKNIMNISTKESLITLDLKALKRLEIYDDEK